MGFKLVLSRVMVDMLAPVVVGDFWDGVRFLGDSGSGSCVTPLVRDWLG